MNGEDKKHLPSGRHIIRSLKAKHMARRSLAVRISDWLVTKFGSVGFLLLNVFFFAFWIAMNSLPGINHLDPFPFIMLTTMVSLEAIILSIFVLITQNRAAKVDDLREEVDLEVDLTSEKEVTKLMKLMVVLLKKNGVDVENDPEIKEMVIPINESKIEKTLEKQV